MNVSGNAEMNENANVVQLFSSSRVEMPDPLQELLNEAEAEAWAQEEVPLVKASRILLTENQFPDQSMFLLEQQLANLKKSLDRLKFYLGDLDDLLPL